MLETLNIPPVAAVAIIGVSISIWNLLVLGAARADDKYLRRRLSEDDVYDVIRMDAAVRDRAAAVADMRKQILRDLGGEELVEMCDEMGAVDAQIIVQQAMKRLAERRAELARMSD